MSHLSRGSGELSGSETFNSARPKFAHGHGLRTISRAGLGLGAILVVTTLVAGTVAACGGGGGGGWTGKSTACPNPSTLGTYSVDPNLTATFVLQGTGNWASYTFGSTNESPSQGVPGLVAYCVYPSAGSMPRFGEGQARGWNGEPFWYQSNETVGYLAFVRSDGNFSNIPFDGTQGITIGDATWSGESPTAQTILLHIVDPAMCAQLYPSKNLTGNLSGDIRNGGNSGGYSGGGYWGHGGWGHGGSSGNSGGCFVYPTQVNTRCSVPESAPSALHVSVASPDMAVPSGTNVTAEFELSVPSFTWADHGVTIFLPSLNVHFPTSGGGQLLLYFAPSNVTIHSGGWTSPMAVTKTLTSGTTFTSSPVWLSSANLAVMFAGHPTNLTLEFQWGWIVNASGTVSQQWSTPSTTATYPDYPSIFSVAPYVSILSTSSVSAAGGTYFWIELSGAVRGTTFKTLVETPTGVELHCQTQTSPGQHHKCHSSWWGWGGPSTFYVGVPLTYYNMTAISPGKYLIHIHDQMGAIVEQVSITIT